MADSTNKHVKFYVYQGKSASQIRRQSVENSTFQSWEKMCHLITSMLPRVGDGVAEFSVEYEDNEGDNVLVTSPAEWEECVHLDDCLRRTYDNFRGRRSFRGNSCSPTHPEALAPFRLHIFTKGKKEKGMDSRRTKDKSHLQKQDLQEEKYESRKESPVRSEQQRHHLALFEPSHFYTQPGCPLPNAAHLQDIQRTAISLLEAFLPRNWTSQVENIPEWIRPALTFGCNNGNVDINLDALEKCLDERALKIMNENSQEALELLQISSVIHPTTSKTYNQACCLAVQDNKGPAIELLRTAIREGFCNFEHMLNDEDLANLYDEPEFQLLLEELQVGKSTNNFAEVKKPVETPVQATQSNSIACRRFIQTPSTEELLSEARDEPVVTSSSTNNLQCSQSASSATFSPMTDLLWNQLHTLASSSIPTAIKNFTSLATSCGIIPLSNINVTSVSIAEPVVNTTTTMTITTKAVEQTKLSTTTPASLFSTTPTSQVVPPLPVVLPVPLPACTAESKWFIPAPIGVQKTSVLATAKPLPVVPPEVTLPKPPAEEFPYQNELHALEEMGFTDFNGNRQLLLETKGNVRVIIDRLLGNLA
jgi:hypothetical protein